MSSSIYKCTDINNHFVLCSGYFCPGNVDNLDQLRKIKDHVKQNAGKFALPVQIVMTEWRGVSQVQMLLAAPNLALGNENLHKASDCADICEALVVPQYRAAAELACMLGIALFLTRVGQGVFNNPSKIMKVALEEVLKVANNRNMWIYLDGKNKDWDGEIRDFLPSYGTGIQYGGVLNPPKLPKGHL
jgi:hypothetical protein